MSAQIKQLIFKPINWYVSGILLLALLYYLLLIGIEFKLPNIFTWVTGVLALLLVWQCGFRIPYLGMISMERLVQFHLLLTLPISETLAISIVASFIMPFINESYRMHSYHMAVLRALNNLAMNTFMLLSAYMVLNHGMVLPIQSLDVHNMQIIAVAAVVMQFINISMLYFYFSFNKKKIYQLFTKAYLFADFIFVPVGVLSALLWQMSDPMLFGLFVFFMLVLLVTFYGLNKKDSDEKSMPIYKGAEDQATFMDLANLTEAIKSRSDQLFNFQALFLITTEPDLVQSHFLIKSNQSKATNLPAFALKLAEKSLVEHDSYGIDGQKVSYMTAPFVDRNDAFAQLVVARVNQQDYLYSDLKLLQLLVKRYNAGLSYAMTFAKLSDYKNNLELLVAERTNQLERVNQEKSELVEKLKKLTRNDALTALYNRRYFDGLLKHMVANPPKQVSLAILDIDHFKKVNDTYGHDAGDQVLKNIAKIMQQWASPNCKLIRYGGEEFVIVIKDMEPKEAQNSLQKLLGLMALFQWSKTAAKQPITVSIGLAHYPECDLTNLFEQADKALYQAKSNGRNQLQLYKR